MKRWATLGNVAQRWATLRKSRVEMIVSNLRPVQRFATLGNAGQRCTTLHNSAKPLSLENGLCSTAHDMLYETKPFPRENGYLLDLIITIMCQRLIYYYS